MVNFFGFLVSPITNVLVILYQALHFIHVPYALGFAIVALTVLIRLVLYPFTMAQMRSSLKMQKVAPHVSKVREKHKGDAKKIQEETMKLYKQHGVNPAAGCLPTLIQLPVFLGLYQALNNVVSYGPRVVVHEVNALLYSHSYALQGAWDPTFFGLALGKSPHALMSSQPIVIIVPVITAILQYYQSKMMMPQPQQKTNKDDFSSMFASQSLYLLPLMIGYFSFSFALGLSLYWNTFSLFGILQQYLLQRSEKHE